MDRLDVYSHGGNDNAPIQNNDTLKMILMDKWMRTTTITQMVTIRGRASVYDTAL